MQNAGDFFQILVKLILCMYSTLVLLLVFLRFSQNETSLYVQNYCKGIKRIFAAIFNKAVNLRLVETSHIL